MGPARPRIGAAAPALTRRRCRARRSAGDAAGGGRRRSAPVPVPGRRAPAEPGPAMGALTSRQNAGVEEVDVPANSVYRYPPKSGKRGGCRFCSALGRGGTRCDLVPRMEGFPSSRSLAGSGMPLGTPTLSLKAPELWGWCWGTRRRQGNPWEHPWGSPFPGAPSLAQPLQLARVAATLIP